MSIRLEDDDAPKEPIPLVLPLSYRTVQWLGMLAGGDDRCAGEIIAEMIEAIRVDDEDAHRTRH